jgi:hypothetical protein
MDAGTKRRHICSNKFIALGSFAVIALVLGSPLGATSAAKKPIKIDTRTLGIERGGGNFLISLGTGGGLGKMTFKRAFGPDKTAPGGQQYAMIKETDTLQGKNGTLVIRALGTTYALGIGTSEVWEGTWSIVSGTGDYTGLAGGGRWYGVANLANNSVTKRSTGLVQP